MSDALVLQNLDWARAVAGRRSRTIRGIDPDDVVAQGLMGLVQAARTWRAAGGASFRTFARRRIEGAISDMLRVEDYLGRGTRKAVRADRAPDWITERGMPTRVFDPTSRVHRDGDVAYLAMEPAVDPPQEAALELEARRIAFERQLAKLPPRLAYVTRRRLAGWTLASIGKALGVSEARASQLAKQARGML